MGSLALAATLMVELRHQNGGRQVQSEDGRPAPSFGEGRVCAADGCTTILRRTNPGPLCSTCGAAQRHRSASRKGGKVSTKRDPDSGLTELQTEALEILRASRSTDPERFVYRPGHITPQLWSKRLKALKRAGYVIESKSGVNGGNRLVAEPHEMPAELPKEAQVVCAETPPSCPQESRDGAESASASQQASEPDGAKRWVSQNEQVEHAEPRDPEDGMTDAEAMARFEAATMRDVLPPFAGVETTLESLVLLDPEVAAMDAITHALGPLDDDARRRVLEWAASRWLVDPVKLGLND